MKKLTIADIKSSKVLSKEERKMVVGGMEGNGESALWCIGLKTESGMASCWYTKGSPRGLADRVYPGQNVEIHEVGCDNGGCIMN